jgi:hypothetical protein
MVRLGRFVSVFIPSPFGRGNGEGATKDARRECEGGHKERKTSAKNFFVNFVLHYYAWKFSRLAQMFRL